MIYVFHGEDEYSIACALDEMAASLGDPTLAQLNTTVLDGKEVTLDDIVQACEAMPFLTERRLVIVRGLLERFNPPKGPGSEAGGAKARGESPLAVGLREYLARVPETAILVFVDVVALDKGNPFLAAVKNVRGSLREFKALSGSALAAWIESRVAAVGGRILPSAVQTLAAFVGSDLRRLGLEIDKLMSYAGGRVIDDGMVELLVADAREARIFDLTDAVALHRVDRALGLLHQLTDEGSAPPVVMVMLTRQVRILLQVKELMEQGSTPTAIASHLRLHPYVVDKAIQQARSVSIQRLEDMYRRLLEADAAMKGGKLDAGAALDLLLLDLTRR